MILTRRGLLASATAALALDKSAAAAASESFRFVHITDLHIQPELRAAEGCRQCIQVVESLQPDFVACGGDLVFDAAGTPSTRARLVYDLYQETIKPLSAPVHHVIGNHDVFGVLSASGVAPGDSLYGKRMFEDRVGRLYHRFAHKGWHFFFLDSISLRPQSFVGRIDDQQLAWLKNELGSIPAAQPVVVVTHVPLVTAFPQYASSAAPLDTLHVVNASDVLALFSGHNLKAVLQGHTHVREKVIYNGCQFITSGAVCGNWWRGPRFGNPEGFALITLQNGELTWEYRTYGFHAAV